MAGRPKTMARTATDLADQAFCMAAAVFLATPKQYLDREKLSPDDPIGQAWVHCVSYTMMSMISLNDLRDRLRGKAGLPPIPDRFAEGPVDHPPPAPGITCRAEGNSATCED